MSIGIIASSRIINSFRVNPTFFGLDNSAQTANLDITCNDAWSIIIDDNWATVSSNSGNGNTTVVVSVTSNPTTNRLTILTVTETSSNISIEVRISQLSN
jgi:hypothetical protein